MFVATGAREQLLKRRRSEFADQYVRPLMTEADKLGITVRDLAAMIDDWEGAAMTAGTGNAAATVHDVTMRFRDNTALDGITTSFEQDAITGLLGRNGAGKTTLMQLLTGHRVPTSGRVEVFGASPYENDASSATSASSRRASATPSTSGCATPSPPRPWSSPAGTTTWRPACWPTSTCRASDR